MVPENQKNSEKILKIIQKFPHLLERVENAKNVWKIPENRGKNLEQIPRNSKKFQKNSHSCQKGRKCNKSSKKSEKSLKYSPSLITFPDLFPELT